MAKPKAFQEKYKKYLLGVLSIIFLASVISAEYGLDQNSLKKWTFYSLTSRASELLVGAFLAVTNLKVYKKIWAKILAAVGLLILGLSLIFINQQMRFPGLIALIPCLATACIILAHGQNKTFFGKFLTLKPMVFFGLISYSLYLYHWPLIVFFKYATDDLTEKFLQAGFIFTAAVVLAYVSWRYIELRFRKPSTDSANKSLIKIFLIPTLCLFGFLHVVIHIQGELPFIDYEKMGKTLRFLDAKKYCHNRFDEKTCVFGDLNQKPEILLLGDSHAGHYQAFLEEVGKAQHFSFVARSFDGCAPLASDNQAALKKLKIETQCKDQVFWAAKNIQRFRIIIFAGAWTRYFDPKVFTAEMEKFYEDQVSTMLTELSSQKKKVLFLDQIPLCPGLEYFYGFKFSLKNALMNEAEERKKVIATCGPDSDKANLHFKALVEKNGAEFVSTLSDFQKQVGPMPFYEELYLYKDGGHLNQEGSIFLGKWTGQNSETFKKLFKK